MHEAKIDVTELGRVPADGGWWILNLEEMVWDAVPGGGTWSSFESPDARSSELGIGVHILNPGETPGMYHAESNQEGFLVLSGECLAIVEGEERRMGPWDYLHCPPGTAHITIGAGDGPCAILMVGTRSPDEQIDYIPEPAAQQHGAAVPELTHDPKVAYAGRPPFTRVKSPWPL
jgi:quercetin dioxygenase-like cupin family protein